MERPHRDSADNAHVVQRWISEVTRNGTYAIRNQEMWLDFQNHKMWKKHRMRSNRETRGWQSNHQQTLHNLIKRSSRRAWRATFEVWRREGEKNEIIQKNSTTPQSFVERNRLTKFKLRPFIYTQSFAQEYSLSAARQCGIGIILYFLDLITLSLVPVKYIYMCEHTRERAAT